MQSEGAKAARDLLDRLLAALLVFLLFPLLVLVALFIFLKDGRPIFFQQVRVGKDFKTFRLWKFRTMSRDAESNGQTLTVDNDSRIIGGAGWIRKYKLDEIPQLFNVVKGEMGFVGPRPELPKYVEAFHEEYSRLLSIRPGITDPASLQYFDESVMLDSALSPQELDDIYLKEVLPLKIALSLEYLEQRSLWNDIRVVVSTARRLLAGSKK